MSNFKEGCMMKATLIQHQTPGGSRQLLKDKVPLDTPFVFQIFPIYACNFKCEYCHFSIPPKDRCFVTDRNIMPWDLFRKCIDEMSAFPEKVKVLRFVGMGEPLLHPDIAQMIKYAKQSEVAERVEIITNGSLLTKDLSDELIASGLDRMVISLQGINAKKYNEVSKIDIDYNEFVNNIAYFYKRKTNTHLYLKIVDISLENKAEKEEFFKIFGDICDSIGIETASPLFPGVEMNDELMDERKVTQFGKTVLKIDICPQPFFTMQVNPDGKVVGCYSVTYPEILGDINKETVIEVWKGEKYNNFRNRMLEGRKKICEVCKECTILEYRMSEEDDITGVRDKLKSYYGGTSNGIK